MPPVLRQDSISVTALDSRKFLFSRSLPPTPSGVLPSKWFWWNPERRHGSREVGTSLDAMQQTVGGSIEAYYPFEEQVCIVCNDEGKINGLPLNRAIRDEDTNEIVDIIAGTFFICDCRKRIASAVFPRNSRSGIWKNTVSRNGSSTKRRH